MQATKRRTIALTSQVDDKLERIAKRMGIGVPEYLRFLVFTEIKKEKEENIPTLSERSERAYLEAMKDDAEGKLKTYTNINDFFKEL